MQLITDQEIQKDHKKPMIVALGSFDGVHEGHKKIILETVNRARENDALSGVFTFHPHPLEVLAPEKAPGLITALSQKRRILEQLGVDRFILKAFTREFAATDFQEFVEKYLVEYLRVKGVVIGEDFHFGRGSQGTSETMKALGQKHHFFVKIFNTIRIQGVEVRSTLIRQLIRDGQVEKLPMYLGRPYALVGKVSRGDGRGKVLGFPTANLDLAVDYVMPPYGVYAVKVKVQDSSYPGVANIGLRPTFHKKDLSVEIHIKDFSDNLYDQIVEVELIQMLRAEQSFETSDQLIAQIRQDANQAWKILCK